MSGNQPDNWAEKTVVQFANEVLKERQRERKWRIFFRIVTLLIILWILFLVAAGSSSQSTVGPHTALIKLEGAIYPGGENSAENVIKALEAAYKNENTKGIILKINSPGGTAVQSSLMANAISRLRAEYPKIPFYVVVDEMCASGGYFVASAADKIFVNESSVVGSIGVLFDSFGFNKAMDKLGIERRMVTAGSEKGFMDPFSPESEKDKAHIQGLLNDIHKHFIDTVKAGRGERLKLDTPYLFSGLVWAGAKSVEIGLADGFGDVEMVSRELVKAPQVVDFTMQENIAERLARQFGATANLLSRVSAEANQGAMMLYQ